MSYALRLMPKTLETNTPTGLKLGSGSKPHFYHFAVGRG